MDDVGAEFYFRPDEGKLGYAGAGLNPTPCKETQEWRIFKRKFRDGILRMMDDAGVEFHFHPDKGGNKPATIKKITWTFKTGDHLREVYIYLNRNADCSRMQ